MSTTEESIPVWVNIRSVKPNEYRVMLGWSNGYEAQESVWGTLASAQNEADRLVNKWRAIRNERERRARELAKYKPVDKILYV